MSRGPFTDEMVRNFVLTLQTQDVIQRHGVQMAEFLAEAAIASEKVGRGTAMYALGQWSELIKEHAAKLIRERKANPDTPKLSAPDVIEGKNG